MELASLTGLRGLAALCILIAHTTPFSSAGMLGMPLFFVLSGFVIHYGYANAFVNDRNATRRFLVARFARLFPLLFFALACVALGPSFRAAWVSAPELLTASYALNIFSWFPIWVNGKLLIQAHPLGLAWSISTEWFFYGAYIFFAKPLASASRAQTIALIGAVCVASYAFQLFGVLKPNALVDLFGIAAPAGADFNNSSYRWLYYVSPYSRIFEFLLGALAAQLFMQRAAQPAPRGAVLASASALALAFFGMVAFFATHADWTVHAPLWVRFVGHLHMNFAFAPFIALLIYCLAARDLTGAKGLLTLPLALLIGQVSYSIYLLHPIANAVFRGLPQYVETAGTIGLTFVAAIVSYRLIEAPARKYLKRWLDPLVLPRAARPESVAKQPSN
jgi:peptidoglycan/LPS O-acetylase OafA/YrhL